MVLVLKNEMLEVVFQGQVFGRLVAGGAGTALLRWQAGICIVVLKVAQLDVDAQQLGGDFRALTQNYRALDSVFQLTHIAWP
ncbi:hypothetical protein D3C86_2123670 [compost metagenome]